MKEAKELIINIFNLDQQLRKQTTWSVALILGFNSQTTLFLKELVKKFGIPTPSKIGKETADKFAVLLTHCEDLKFIKKVISSKEFKEEPFEKDTVAIAIDELLVKSGQKQRFGTVLRSYEKNGKVVTVPMPISNIKQVNKRRAEFGIKTTLEEYIKYAEEVFKKIKR